MKSVVALQPAVAHCPAVMVSQLAETIGAEFTERIPIADVDPVPPVTAEERIVGVAAMPVESCTRMPTESFPPPPMTMSLLITAPVDPVTVMPALVDELFAVTVNPSSCVYEVMLCPNTTPLASCARMLVTHVA